MLSLALAFLQQQQLDPAQAQKMAMAVLAIMPILCIVGLAIVILPTWFICKKAGFSPWLSLLVIVPFGGLVLLYVLAFAEWKVVPVPQTAYTPPMPPAFPPQA
jgi:intracellular septation protein A